MTNDEIVELGHYVEVLFSQPEFNTLVSHFEQQCAQNILGTTAGQEKVREQVFAAFDGFRSFLGMLRSYVEARDAILAEPSDPESLSEDDATNLD